MHAKIIQLSSTPLAEEDFIDSENVWGDSLVEMRSDWVGDRLTPAERRDYVKNVKRWLESAARIDTRKMTMSFPGNKELIRIYRKWFSDVLDTMRRDAESGTGNITNPEVAQMRLQKWYGGDDLFYFNDNVYDSSSFIHDVAFGYIPTELYIGGIVDFHF